MEYTCKHIDGELEFGRTTINAHDGFFVGGPGAPIERLTSIPDLVRDSVIATYGKRGWNIEIKCWKGGGLFGLFLKRSYCTWTFTAK